MNIAIIGGSLTGLAAANVLIRLGIMVKVFEKFPASFEKRGSSLGFVDVSLWESIRGGETMMRFGRRAGRDQGAYFYGDLWQFLYQGLPEGCVRFNYTVNDLGNDPTRRPTIDGTVYDAAIVADGGWSSLRHYINGNRRPEYAGYVICRSKVNVHDLPNFKGEGAYTSGKYFAIALTVPTIEGSTYIMGGIAVGMPENKVTPPSEGVSRHTELSSSSAVPDWFLPFVRRTFRNHGGGEILRWIEACAAEGKVTPQPLYEFMAEKVVNGRLILMGDAAHMASPRTAAGAHTGILDAAGLFEAFTRHPGPANIDDAIKAYESGGLRRARELYMRSIEVSLPVKYEVGDEEL